MARDEGVDVGGRGGPSDRAGHVEREEVARRQEPLDRLERDVIGVDEVGRAPAQRADGALGRRAHVGRLRPHGIVFAVRLVPDRHDAHALLRRQSERLQLRLRFVGEAVAHAE